MAFQKYITIYAGQALLCIILLILLESQLKICNHTGCLSPLLLALYKFVQKTKHNIHVLKFKIVINIFFVRGIKNGQ